MEEFRAAKGLKARAIGAHEILKNIADLKDKAGAAKEVIAALNTEIATHQRTQPSVALEGIFARDELREATELPATPGEIPASAIWHQEINRLGSVLEAIPAAKHRRALASFKESNAERWQDAMLGALNQVSAKLAAEIAHALISGGKFEQFKETLARLISQHQASSELLLWLARERSDTFADILSPEVFRAMLTAMERDQFNEKRSSRI
jgi:hypothetical protein